MQGATSCYSIFLVVLLCLLGLWYLLTRPTYVERTNVPHREHHCHREVPKHEYFEKENEEMTVDEDEDEEEEETLTEEESVETDQNEKPPPIAFNESEAPVCTPPLSQRLVDFSDTLVTEEERGNTRKTADNADQVQSVNERFDAAKRKTVENRLKPGIYNQQQRRKIVETLLRRPACSRRVRSWRTENSDILRGDVIPKSNDSWGVLKMGRNNPLVDLHPGALGPMSGMVGQWNSEENVPSNIFEENEILF